MPTPWLRAAACIAILLMLSTRAGHAASFDCRSSSLTLAQTMICGDQELSQADERIARRVRDMQKRNSLGLYLGIRYWANRSAEMLDACGRERPCLVAAYRAQQRLLDRLQACLDSSIRKRSCLRVVIHSDETAQGGAAAGRTRPQ